MSNHTLIAILGVYILGIGLGMLHPYKSKTATLIIAASFMIGGIILIRIFAPVK
jgi:hypothetical protein